MSRRLLRLSVLAALALAGLAALPSCLASRLGGAFSHEPEELAAGLSPGAAALLERAYEGLDPRLLTDYHTHLAGLGTGGTGCTVNPKMLTWLHPINRFKFKIYMSASDVEDLDRADQQFRDRLVALVRGMDRHGLHYIMAFERRYRPDGTIDEEHTEFHVPNEYVFATAEKHPDLFRPVISIHPYRKDALAELERFAARGGRLVKWLPNSMGMDPGDPRCDPFYERMRDLKLILISHGGDEQAVDVKEDQALGNPLKLRRPLNLGVRVIVAHCASLGLNADLDDPARTPRPAFELFLRLMGEERYKGLLFGEISAMTQFNRLADGALATLIKREDLHARLVNGSDYPLPAINALVRTGALEGRGYLTSEERAHLNEIYDYNPLLYDFVLKRTIRSPGTDLRFPPRVFEENSGLR